MLKSEKLNLGAGRKSLKDYVNLDMFKLPGIDVVHDLNKYPWPFKDHAFSEVRCPYVLEMLSDFIKAVEEIYRISKPNAIIKVSSPLFPNMRSAQDPLTKTLMTYNTFDYFAPSKHHLNYYSKAKLKVLKREIVFSRNKYLRWLSFLPNINQKFYVRFLFNLFPANEILYTLKVVK